MLFIQHNLIAQNANRQLNISTGKNAKITEKLSSGYRINRAADDAAGLAISEKMRRQIRGLMQGTANAKDGISYVQVADGAMNEGHEIMQRMNELAIKSLNGTLTESDRAALNAEFDQLRTEMDRINKDTEFNNQRVFEDHEPSYYQIQGNRKWNDNQLHTVFDPGNDLIINLPDSYVPNHYTLTVPEGIYTTQELIDEIDDALCNMTPPNPGFVFEYTDKGYCNLNFESASGMPTEIASVEGSLAYLIYDLYADNPSGNLLGTGEFPIQIYKGYNDTLGFYIDGVEKEISMTIPEGNYTRDEMIEWINGELAQHPEAEGVVAKEYGNSNIQITGGSGVNITGLKGNMFRWESYTEKYSSVFYDNLQYGISQNDYARITGNATDTISIKSGENDTLRFKLNESADYTEITIPANEYTISELAKKINELFEGKGIDKEITASGSTALSLSSLLIGKKSRLEFDTTSSPVFKNTYESLFCKMQAYSPDSESTTSHNAYFLGKASLTGDIELPQNTLTFRVDGTSYTISGLKNTYSNLNGLVTELNGKLDAALSSRIEFKNSSNRLQIAAKVSDIKNIEVASGTQKGIYDKLFVGKRITMNSLHGEHQTGRIENLQQGLSATIITEPYYSVEVPANQEITINSTNNKISFSTTGGDGVISLDAKSYNVQQLVDEINRKLHVSSNPEGLRNITASYDSGSGRLFFRSQMPKDYPKYTDYNISLKNTNDSDSAWEAIVGTTENTDYPVSVEPVEGKTTLTTHLSIAESITLDDTNNVLELDIGSGKVSISIAKSTYTSREALKGAVQDAIDKTALNGKVTVNITNDNKLQFYTPEAQLEASGNFHDNVLVSEELKGPSYHTRQGSSSYTPAFIIGRKDLTQENIEIISDANDKLIFDFAYYTSTTVPLPDKPYLEWSPISVTIPEGIYSGETIAAVLTERINAEFSAGDLSDFEVKVMVNDPSGQISTKNEIDKAALKIAVNRKGSTAEPAKGTYILDGVRGSAAGFIFYKTTNALKMTYITGTKDLTNGVTFQPGKNVLTLSADSVPYQYTFPENVFYTADEFVALLNDKFKNGDDNGNEAPLVAEIDKGVLRIRHKTVGAHTISDVGGSARSTVFFQEEGRDSSDPLAILVSAEAGDHIEIPRTSVGSCSLRINSITISKPKYAEKAVQRIKEAINLLSNRRSTYGAIQNRLEHTVNNNNNIIENTQASEAAIRDTDMADMMMEYSINNILMQAGTSILAQANQSSQLMLSLLR